MKPTYVQTIDLYPILQDPKSIDRLHELMRKRALDGKLNGKERPDGLRLSQDCPVRRVKQYFDPIEWSVPFDQGVATRGFFVEDLVQVHLENRAAYKACFKVQPAIKFSYGESAFDFMYDFSGHRVISVKSAFSKSNPKPSTANIRQEMRMVAMAQSTTDINMVEWWMVDNTLRAYIYTLDMMLDKKDSLLGEAALENDRVAKAVEYYQTLKDKGVPVNRFIGWDDPEFWQIKFGLEARSNPFIKPAIDATGEIENQVRLISRARKDKKSNEQEFERAKEVLRPLVVERLAKEGKTAGTVQAYTEPLNFTITKSGALTIKEREEK